MQNGPIPAPERPHTSSMAQPAAQTNRAPDEAIPTKKGTRMARLIALFAAGLLLAGVGAGSWYWLNNHTPVIAAAGNPSSSGPERMVVTPQPASATVALVGVIAPAATVPIIAPFDGVIRERAVQLGDYVEEGGDIMVLDTSEITSRYREAQTAYLRAVMAAQEMEDWEDGPEVQRARRSLETADAQLASLERQVTELQVLLDRGIIARNEFDNLAQQRDTQRITAAGARTDYEALLGRASAEQRELVEVELENTRARVEELRAQLEGASVSAPATGIVIRPPDTNNNWSASSIEPGSNLTRGTAILSIADTTSLVVSAHVDEIEVNQIQIGQPVEIESEAVGGPPIVGSIISISAEARQRDGGTGPAMFEIRAAFTPDADIRPLIRVGMSARMTVIIYENDQALLVPPRAILSGASGNRVQVVAADGNSTEVPIVTGRSFADGIEILSGLTPGAEIVLEASPAQQLAIPDEAGSRGRLQLPSLN